MSNDAAPMLVARAEGFKASGDLAAGLAAAEQAWALVAREDAPLRCRTGLLLAHFLYRTGALAPMVDVALEVLPLLRAGGSTAELIDLLRQVTLVGCDVSRFDVALASAQEAYGLAVGIGDTARISLATNALGCFFERTGDPWQAERLLLEALVLARSQPERHPLFVTLNNLGAALIGKFYLLRDTVALEEARAPLRVARPYAQEAVALAKQSGDVLQQVFSLGNLGEILVHLGAADDAARTLDESLAQARQGGFEAQVWRIGCSIGELQLLRGQPRQAWDTLNEVMRASGAAEQRITHMRLHHALWRAARELGRTEEALQHLQTYLRMERQRAVTQLRAQSDLFVTRVEAEQMRQETQRHRARAHELEADVRRDPLTGLGNRHEMERRWPELLQQAQASGTSLSVAMLDLDHFKQVNDRHGHAVGDRVLVALAGLLRAHTRSADLVVRTGGEEFLLVLPDTDAARAFEVCDRLRQRVEAHPWIEIAPDLGVTLSMGLTSSPPLDAAALSLRADAALYRAKDAGRNRLVQG